MKRITLLFVVMTFAFVVKAQEESAPFAAKDSLTIKSGWGWKTTDLGPNQTLVINENFQDWPLNHNQPNNSVATKARASADAYIDWDREITLDDGTKANISMIKCASAPQGLSQNKIEFTPVNDPDDGIYQGNDINFPNGRIPDPERGDPLSVGFLEISRSSSNGTGGAYHGSVTLPAIAGAQIVQYSYSSIGGNKRALILQRSVDNGETWTDVRNSSSGAVNWSTTENDGNSSTAVLGENGFSSGYYCSGAGVYIEDIIGDGTETVMLRFTIHNNQDYRLHDLKVIALKGGSSISTVNTSSTKIIGQKGQIEITGAQASVTIYSVTGQKVATFVPAQGSQIVSVPSGVYMVAERDQPVVKVLVK
jgi:hypothetical protein